MLSFAQQVEMTEYICAIYDQIETELLRNLAESFAAAQYGGSTEWRAQMLERMGWYNRKNAAIIAKYSGKSQSAVEEIFRDLGVGALIHEETLYQTAFDRGILTVRPVNVAESAAISQILDAAAENAGSYLNLVNTTCAECAKSAYMDVVNKAYIETTTGIKDYTTSIRQAVNQLAKDGITTVTYYRKDGSKIRYPVDAAVRRNILTSIGQTTGKMQIARAGEWGCNYMEVTSHAGARPSHAEWQGQVYQINGSSAEYDNLYDATGYGTGDGLKGWNCRHDMYPFIPGISERGSFPIDQEENEKEYKLTQEQRKLEREVRQFRRECVAADATGDKTAFMKSSLRLKDKEAELKEFIRTTDRTQTARVSTAGFNRSVSQKAVQAKKGLKYRDFNDIIALQGSLSNRDVREWYLAHDATIPNLIDRTATIEEQARQACNLRIKFRVQARDLMPDQEERKELDKKYPCRSFEELLADKMQRKGMTREEAVEDILKTATKTRESVNKQFGLEGQ